MQRGNLGDLLAFNAVGWVGRIRALPQLPSSARKIAAGTQITNAPSMGITARRPPQAPKATVSTIRPKRRLIAVSDSGDISKAIRAFVALRSHHRVERDGDMMQYLVISLKRQVLLSRVA
jgi:hypothetical protein